MQEALPAGHLQWDGGLGFQAIAVWYFIALATLVEPAFYQRCYAARDEKTAKWGIAAAIVFWICFDFLTTTAGLYARALMPNLDDPVQAFPALAQLVLPSFWQGVFTVGLLATIMSTVDSYAFIGSITLGRDLIGRWRGLEEEESLPLIRWSLRGHGRGGGGPGAVVRVGDHLVEGLGFDRYPDAIAALDAGPYPPAGFGSTSFVVHAAGRWSFGGLAGSGAWGAVAWRGSHIPRTGGFGGNPGDRVFQK